MDFMIDECINIILCHYMIFLIVQVLLINLAIHYNNDQQFKRDFFLSCRRLARHIAILSRLAELVCCFIKLKYFSVLNQMLRWFLKLR